MKRLLFEGEIAVADTGYIQHLVVGDDEDEDIDVAIERLDERLTNRAILTFTLDYPFEKPYDGKVITDAGASLRQIIDAIREAFQRMYRGVTIEDIAQLHNKRVRGDFGQALHVIEDLVIESIELDDATGQLDIQIGS